MLYKCDTMEPDENYPYFYEALKHFVPENKRDGIQKDLHYNAGISQSLLSMIRSGSRKGSTRVHMRIAKALGYSYEEFIKFGRSLILAEVTESSTSTDTVDAAVTLADEPLPPPGPLPTPDIKPKPPSLQGNVLGFPDRRKPMPVDTNAMYANLIKICENEDNALVVMIERSLSLLSESVDLKSELTALRDRIEKIEDQLNMEKAEKLSLKAENETLKKRLSA
jgi:hypothetical protein